MADQQQWIQDPSGQWHPVMQAVKPPRDWVHIIAVAIVCGLVLFCFFGWLFVPK